MLVFIEFQNDINSSSMSKSTAECSEIPSKAFWKAKSSQPEDGWFVDESILQFTANIICLSKVFSEADKLTCTFNILYLMGLALILILVGSICEFLEEDESRAGLSWRLWMCAFNFSIREYFWEQVGHL